MNSKYRKSPFAVLLYSTTESRTNYDCLWLAIRFFFGIVYCQREAHDHVRHPLPFVLGRPQAKGPADVPTRLCQQQHQVSGSTFHEVFGVHEPRILNRRLRRDQRIVEGVDHQQGNRNVVDLTVLVGFHQLVRIGVVRDVTQCAHCSVIMIEVIESVDRDDGVPIDFLPMDTEIEICDDKNDK